jgi:hypothetical protein
MGDTTSITERDTKGRFLAGNNGGGRPKGSRNKLGEQFISDVRDAWERHGVEVLDRVAKEQPDAFLRAMVALMPKDIHATLDIGINPQGLLQSFRTAVEALGNTPSTRLPRPVKVINNAG